jgi:Glycosyl transferase family 2
MFSVVLPVRNGWPYVQECVESILGQTDPDFELIVLDNCSTDYTVAWLKSLTDERIRLSRSTSDLSIVESWGRIKGLQKREYMTLIGHDDKLDPGFLASVKALIGRHPDATLYQTGARLINSEGRLIRNCRPVPAREMASGYLKARFAFERDISGTGFVMRSADYDRHGGIPPFEKLFFADDALWLSLVEGSYKAADPTELCSVRLHPKSESASLPSQWPLILRGLTQFSEFLEHYVARDLEAGAITADHGPDFQRTYHRNIYIFALVDACSSGRKIDSTTVAHIAESLARFAPAMAGTLSRSPKVAAIKAMNATPLRVLVPHLWSAYYRLRTGS